MVTLLACAALLAESHALPPLRPFDGVRSWYHSHRALLQTARQLQSTGSSTGGEGGDTPTPAGTAAPVVSWQRLWRELSATQQARYVAPASALSLLLTASELIAPRVRGELFDMVVVPGATMAAMWPRLRLLALLALLGWALEISSAILFARARWEAAMAARVRLMDAVLRQEPGFFDAAVPGELSSRLLSEPERLEALANRGPERALSASLSVCGGLLLMLRTDLRLAAVAVALRAPLIGLLAEAAGRTVGLLGVLQQRALNEANALASEALGAPHTVAAQGARRAVLAEYARRVERYMEVLRATLNSETVLRFTRLGTESLTKLLLLGFGLRSVLYGRLSLGGLLAFYAYADTFGEGCKKLQELLHDVCTIRPACSRFFELLDRQPAMAWDGGEVPAARATGALRLDEVSVTFPGRTEPALRNVSLSVAPGETLALVGPSGAGKSTLLKLLLRLYDPDRGGGGVLLDGVDLRRLDLHWLRGQAGYVSQSPSLFDHLSVDENVGFGSSPTPSRPEIDAALDAAGATEFVCRLPGGGREAATLGEGGKRLSGGQRQRLAFARAIAGRPPVLLLDEATSALDGGTERQVQAALRSFDARRPTTVLAAHRLSSVLHADRVATLVGGRIVEMGTPAELASAEGWFQRNFYPAPAAGPDSEHTR